jgi:hypothetical protein
VRMDGSSGPNYYAPSNNQEPGTSHRQDQLLGANPDSMAYFRYDQFNEDTIPILFHFIRAERLDLAKAGKDWV